MQSFVLSASLLLVSIVSPATSFGQVAVSTYHNDNARTGANLNETILNTSNVNVGGFGKLFSRTVDGQVFAQPLYVPSVAIPSQGTHNVIYVVTQHNSVYAFDADVPAASAPVWQVNLGSSVPVTVWGPQLGSTSEFGILSTPVIDLKSSTLYVVADHYENNAAVYRLHALDLSSGSEKFNGPVVIQGSVPGTGIGSVNGVMRFDPFMHWQRPGLLLLNGNVYIGFASHGDTEPFHGWLFAYRASTLEQVAIRCLAPNGDAAGIWQGGVGLAGDGSGNIYLETGNGTMDADTGAVDFWNKDFGNSVVKLSSAAGMPIIDYFSPSNQDLLNNGDIDFGSSGPLLIPGTSLGVAGGKDGKLFVFDTNSLGFFHNTDQVVQAWQATYSLRTTGAGGIYGGLAYYNSKLYLWGRRDTLKVFSLNGSTFNTTPSSQTNFTVPDGETNEPAMSVSANGTAAGTGILWAAYSANGGSAAYSYPAILRAFDASDVTKELWNSSQNNLRDYPGQWAKWNPPTVANGKVYLASFDNVIDAYGVFGKGGTLSGSASSASVAANLTAEGGADWAHWGDTVVNHKAGVPAQLSSYSVVGSGIVNQYSNDPRALSWTDGVPAASGIDNTNGVSTDGLQNGFTITAPADTAIRTLILHVGGFNSGGTLTAYLSDGSALEFVDVTPLANGRYDRDYTLAYRAVSPGQILTVAWVMTSGTGSVTLNGAALSLGTFATQTVSATAGNLQSTAAGAPFASPLQAIVRDAASNPVGGVSVTFTAPDTGPSAGFNGSLAVTVVSDNNGVATSPPLAADGRAGSYIISASIPGSAAAARFALSNQTGSPASVTAVAGSPQAANSNTTFSTPLKVLVADAVGNPIGGVTVTFNAPTSGAGGSFGGAFTATAISDPNGFAIAPIFFANPLAGTYSVTASASGVAGLASFRLTNNASATNGSLSGSVSSAVTGIDLTAEGSSDWIHWGDSVLNRKSGVTQQISNYTALGSGTVVSYSPDPRPISWSDGAPTASSTNNRTGLYVSGLQDGFSITAPADTTTRTLTLHVGGYSSGGTLTAYLSDGSGPAFSDSEADGGLYNRNFTLVYKASSAGQTLTVAWTMTSGTGTLNLSAAALGGATSIPGSTTPSIYPGSTVNAASFTAGAPVSPGSIATVFGTNLASSSSQGVITKMNGFPSFLFDIYPGQLNFQVPWELSGQAQAFLTVAVDGVTSSPAVVRLAVYSPGIFPIGQSGQGAVIIASSGEVAAPGGSIPGRAARPVNRGEYVTIYCTGLGPVTNRPPTGAKASDNAVSLTTAIPTVTIGNAIASTTNDFFSGLAPGYIGLYQVNVQVPPNSPTGDAVPLILSIGGVMSNTVTIAVQ